MLVSPPPTPPKLPSTYFGFRTGIFDLKRSSRGQTPPAIFHFIYLLKNILFFLKDEKDVRAVTLWKYIQLVFSVFGAGCYSNAWR